MSKTYTIQQKDTRGLATLVGLVATLVLSRLWWTGALEEMIATVYQPEGEALSSTTYVVLSFAANVIYGVGTVLVMAWSGLWWLIGDVTAGIRRIVSDRKAVKDATDDVVVDAEAEQTLPMQIVDALMAMERNVKATHDMASKATEYVAGLKGDVEQLKGRLDAMETVAAEPKPKTTTRRRTTSK